MLSFVDVVGAVAVAVAAAVAIQLPLLQHYEAAAVKTATDDVVADDVGDKAMIADQRKKKEMESAHE